MQVDPHARSGDAAEETRSATRECPTLPGDRRPLIIHRIEPALCTKRQTESYHRCHRCVYRGHGEDWVYDAPSPFQPAASVAAGVQADGLAGGA